MQAVLCLLLLIRRSYREFPMFFAFSAVSVTGEIAGLAVRNNTALYGDVYWTNEVLSVFLVFFALQESFRSVFRNFFGMKWFRWLFPGIGILMIVVAVLRTILLPRPAHSLFTVTILGLEIGVAFLQFGIFSLFIVLISIFHLRWRQHPVGIVLGFGICAAGYLVALLLRFEIGTEFDPVVRIALALSYIIGVAVWIVTFLRGEPSGAAKGDGTPFTPEQMITELRRHTKVVKGILGR